MFKRGDIVAYHYLWSRQAEAGEETGRKARPTCLLIATRGDPQRLYLFPITTQAPHGRAAVAIPDIERRRAGLGAPSWVIVDELNLATSDALHDVAAPKPLGSFSPAFLRSIARVAADRITQGLTKIVRRT
ncbi:MAG: hypothetical protein LCH93_20365 [Proteobacteria bacterium]|nr:hypothetical protein [Pseudomonadota bacterium]